MLHRLPVCIIILLLPLLSACAPAERPASEQALPAPVNAATVDAPELLSDMLLPLWMEENLESQGISWSVPRWALTNYTTTLPWESGQRTAFTFSYDLALQTGSDTHTFSDLSLTVARRGDTLSAGRRGYWADSELLYLTGENTVEIYRLADGLPHVTTLDFAPFLEEGEGIALAFQQNVEDVGQFLVVPVLGGKESSFFYLLLDNDGNPLCRTLTTESLPLEGSAYGDARVLLEPSDFYLRGEFRMLGDSILIAYEEGVPVLCRPATVVMDDTRRHDSGQNLRIYSFPDWESASERHPELQIGRTEPYLAVYESKSGGRNLWLESLESDYQLTLAGAINDLIFDYDLGGGSPNPDYPGYSTYYTPIYDMDNGQAHLYFARDGATLTLDFNRQSARLSVSNDMALLRQERTDIYDCTSDGRHQLWKVRMRLYYEGQSSNTVLYDNLTGQITDFGLLWDSMFAGFVDDNTVYVIRYLPDRYQQELLLYDIPSGTLKEAPIPLDLVNGYGYVRSYGYDSTRGRHLLVFTVQQEGWWASAGDDSVPTRDIQNQPSYDTYLLAVYDNSGTLLSVDNLHTSIFHQSMFAYAPATIQERGGDYYLYSVASPHSGPRRFSPATGETVDSFDLAYLDHRLTAKIKGMEVKPGSYSLSALSNDINDYMQSYPLTADHVAGYFQRVQQSDPQAGRRGNLYYTSGSLEQLPDTLRLYLYYLPGGAHTKEEEALYTSATYYLQGAETPVRDIAVLYGGDGIYLACAQTDETLYLVRFNSIQGFAGAVFPENLPQGLVKSDKGLRYSGFSLSLQKQSDSTLLLLRDGAHFATVSFKDGELSLQEVTA